MIKGGYYIKARKIRESEIMHMPPHVREVWDWFLMKANHDDYITDKYTIKRGQLYTSISEIINELHWMIGFRKMHYSVFEIKHSMKALRKLLMITSTKTPRGVIVTICKYDYYQNPKNYESSNESSNENPMKAPTIIQEVQEEEKINTINTPEKKFPAPIPEIHFKTKNDFLDAIIEKFKQAYIKVNKIEYILATPGKERQAAGTIINLYKKKYPQANTAEALEGLYLFFEKCVGISDEWLKKNMSLPIIVSQFNQINKILLNGRGTNKQGASIDEIRESINNNFPD